MTASLALDARADRAAARAPAPEDSARRPADDARLLRAAAEIARDLHVASPAIYWTDLLASAALGYAGLAAAILAPSLGLALIAAMVSVLALYRAESFTHELTHMKHSSLPGFRLGWNAVIGVPLMVPSFMYEGVHNLHHAKTRYGTVEDPEYLPLARMTPWATLGFVLISALAPIGLLIRHALLTPLSWLSPKLRAVVIARYSGLVINPDFRRRAPEGEAARRWRRQEIVTSIWAIGLLALVASGVVPLRAFLIFLAIAAAVAVINQVRTLVAHLWENDGTPMTVTAQYLDSVNVPPPALLPALWAPVGLRYHALHHLLPSLPYHALGEAHRRLVAALGPESTYQRGNHPGLTGLVARLVRSAAASRR